MHDTLAAETREIGFVWHVRSVVVGLLLACGLAGCATETHQVVPTEQPVAAATPYAGPKSALVVGDFANRSSYMRGMFSDGVDRLGSQAKTILVADLQST